jgi:hypothetical protein
MSLYESAEQARGSVHPGDVVTALGSAFRVVSWDGVAVVVYPLDVEEHKLEIVDWSKIDDYHHRDHVDVDEVLEGLPDDVEEPDPGVVPDTDQAEPEDVEKAVADQEDS